MTTDILECGHAAGPHSSFTTGYGMKENGDRYCYDCCAADERQRMIDTGKATLYLVSLQGGHGYEVIDWPGHLRFRVTTYNQGRHNMAGTRTDVWFIGPDRHWWHGVQYGRNTEIVHCRRTQEEVK